MSNDKGESPRLKLMELIKVTASKFIKMDISKYITYKKISKGINDEQI